MATSDSPLNVPDVTLAVARGAGGGSIGSGPLVGTLLDGNTDQGSKIRLEPDGSFSFGTKPQGPPVLQDFGDVAYEWGVANNYHDQFAEGDPIGTGEAGAIWNSSSASPVLVSDSAHLRHSHSARTYRLLGDKASLREPYKYRTDPAGKASASPDLYFAWWLKPKYNATWLRDLAPVSDNGIEFIKDEEIIVNSGEYSGVYAGFVQGDTRPHRVVINGQYNNSNFADAVITGLSSGAEMTLSSETNTAGGMGLPGSKIGRWWDADSGQETGQLRASMALHNGYLSIRQSDGSAVRPYDFDDKIEQTPDQWRLYEIEFRRQAGYFRHTLDGRVRGEASGLDPYGDLSTGLDVSQFGTDGGPLEPQVTHIAECYFDTTLHRVYLADAANWADVTHKELQRLDAWSTSSIEIYLNKGALTSGWLYVIGEDGQPINTTGLEIT